MSDMPYQIAVLVPCYNEEATIGQVVADFRAALPTATIYVYDNNSTDRTAEVARATGAVVRREQLQGKGNVVRRMFADVEADIYVLVDGDATYDAASAPGLVKLLVSAGLDMVKGARCPTTREAYRPGHRLGNRLFTGIVVRAFGCVFNDLLSGYHVMSRRFVKSFPAMAHGFEIETELTVHAVEIRAAVAEVDTPYYSRPEGSHSKLSTVRDGMRILKTIVYLIKEERPLLFFSTAAAFVAFVSLGLGIPVILEYVRSGFVPRFPTAILAAALGVQALLFFSVGLILDSVNTARREARRFRYLESPSPYVLVVAKSQGPCS